MALGYEKNNIKDLLRPREKMLLSVYQVYLAEKTTHYIYAKTARRLKQKFLQFIVIKFNIPAEKDAVKKD